MLDSPDESFSSVVDMGESTMYVHDPGLTSMI